MAIIPQGKLRNDIAAVLRRAEQGERFTVTVSGRPVAELGPLPGARALAAPERLAAILKSQLADREKRRRADFVVTTTLGRSVGARQLAAIVRRVHQGQWRRSVRLRRLRGRVACVK